MTERKGLEKLIFLCEVIKWVDNARWYQEYGPKMDLVKSPENIKNEQKLLIHWLCYITDRQMPYEKVWNEGGVVFSGLVSDFSKENYSVEDIIKDHMHKEGGKIRFKSGESKYASRYPSDDLKSIERTLKLLENYGDRKRAFVNFLGRFIRQYKDSEEGLTRIAHVLDLLTYRKDIQIDVAKKRLLSPTDLDNHYAEWKKTKARGHKRLWAALRDYRKPGSIGLKYLKETLKSDLRSPWEKSKSFSLTQLELPGDIWNERFNEDLIIPLAENAGIQIKERENSKNYLPSPILARNIYEIVKNTVKDFYPEQFDVSFDFSPRMCDQAPRMCNICPFGKGRDIKHLCHRDKEKICSLLLTICSYQKRCDPNNCPIAKRRQGIGYCRAGEK